MTRNDSLIKNFDKVKFCCSWPLKQKLCTDSCQLHGNAFNFTTEKMRLMVSRKCYFGSNTGYSVHEP